MKVAATLLALQFAGLAAVGGARAQSAATAGPPPSSGGVFPLSEVRKGMMATAWTVFSGDKPEPMQVEILGVLRGARGPGQDMILAQLRGAKPEYTGVVAGMSGSPVYIGDKLLGSLSYRIGQFSKDPIAGITPIEQMLEVRDLPVEQGPGTEGLGTKGLRAAGSGTEGLGTKGLDSGTVQQVGELAGLRGVAGLDGLAGSRGSSGADLSSQSGMNFQAMETPLVMSGLGPEAIKLWQQQTAGTGLDMVAAGGMGASSEAKLDAPPSAKAAATIVPGSAVSAQLVRGDIEIAATCTVTYVDPKQLLACGHPILQAGSVSLPMTTTEVVATLASPLNAFKIINTGELIGAFTEDRDSAIRGVFGQKPKMIPVHISVHSPEGDRKLNVEILDLPSLTSQALLVSLYQALMQTNQSTMETSYHLTGDIALDGHSSSPLDEWVSASDGGSAPLELALQAGGRFARIYSSGDRQGSVRGVELHVDAIPRRMSVELETARLVSGDIVRAGDTVMLEATVRPWHQAERNVRISIKVPANMAGNSLRILVSDAATLDRTLNQPRLSGHTADLQTVLAQARMKHASDRIYVSLLVPEAQAEVGGQTLAALPLSVANAMEPLRNAKDVNLNGESAQVAGDAQAGGVFSGFQILTLHVEPGGSLN